MASARCRVRGPPADRARLTTPPRDGRIGTLRRLVRVRSAEWPAARILFGWFFCLTALQHLLKPARNAFFLSTAGSANLPWAYIASAGASVVAMIGYGRWVASQSRQRQVLGAQLVVLGSLVGFWFLLRVPTTWTAGAFYVWIQVFSLLLVSQFFLVGNDLYDPRQAKRLFGFIGAGGLVGGIAGAAAAGFLANEIGTENLLWIGVALAGGCLTLSVRLFRLTDLDPGEARRKAREVRPGRLAGGFSIVRRVPHLRMIALVLFLSMIISTFVDWMYNAAVEAAHPEAERQAEFIGQSFAIFNSIALVLQLFLTSWSLHTLGLAGTLLILPIGVGIGAAGVALLPSIWTAAVAKGADTSPRYSIDQTAREILWLPIPAVLKQRAKPFLDNVVQRSADGLAGILLLLGIGTTALSTRGLGLLTLLGITILGGIAVWGVRRTYRQATERLLAVRDIDLEAAVTADLDPARFRELLEELAPDAEAERVRFTLDLLADVPRGLLESRAIGLLDHPDPGVRRRAIELLEPGGGSAAVESVRPLLEDADPHVRGRALVLLCRTASLDQERRVEEWLESREPGLLEAALVCRLEGGEEDGAGAAARTVGRWVHQPGDEAAPQRAACARALGRLRTRHPVQRHLETLLADGHPEVVDVALRAATASPRLDLLTSILPHLEDGETRPLARRALAAFGEAGIPYLSAALRDPELPVEVRRWIPGAFVSIETPAAYRALVEGLPALVTGRHRLYALKALNKLRRRKPRWAIPVDAVRAELDRELAAGYDLERQIAEVRSARRSGDADERLARLYEEALRHAARSTVERAFRLQGLLYPPQTIYFAYSALTGGDTTRSAHALELLETSLARADAARIVPLIDPDVTPRRRAEIGATWYDLERRDLAEDLKRVLDAGEPWLRSYAVALAAARYPDRLGPEIERLAATGPVPARELARNASRTDEEDDMTLTVVEKAAALRRAELLGELGAEDLLQLATVAEERAFSARDIPFYEGEEGDYLYVILEGRIRLERGDQELFVARPGDTIGTFSILDRRPRSAGAVALEPTRTLAIHRADMAQILADNYGLVEGIFDYLTGIIREMNERVYSVGSRPDDGSG